MRTIDYLQALRHDGAALAADGVGELLEVFLAPHSDGEPVGGRGESLHLHATDTEGEWRVRLLPAAAATQ
jgi:hypothetical protein